MMITGNRGMERIAKIKVVKVDAPKEDMRLVTLESCTVFTEELKGHWCTLCLTDWRTKGRVLINFKYENEVSFILHEKNLDTVVNLCINAGIDIVPVCYINHTMDREFEQGFHKLSFVVSPESYYPYFKEVVPASIHFGYDWEIKDDKKVIITSLIGKGIINTKVGEFHTLLPLQFHSSLMDYCKRFGGTKNHTLLIKAENEEIQ